MTVQKHEEQAPGGERDWHRIFDALPDEHDYVVDEIEGRSRRHSGAPSTATACKNEVGGKPYAHLFDGDAMSPVHDRRRRVRYRNKYVRLRTT